MLNYDLNKPILSDLSLKYDHIEKKIKPLHPIHKNKKLESELEFVSELKKTLRIVFPTVDLGKNTTIQGFMLHMLKIQSITILYNRKSRSSLLEYQRRSCFPSLIS